jgi:hypothetical protein
MNEIFGKFICMLFREEIWLKILQSTSFRYADARLDIKTLQDLMLIELGCAFYLLGLCTVPEPLSVFTQRTDVRLSGSYSFAFNFLHHPNFMNRS